MNETMTQIINAATPILCLLITAGGAYLVALLKRQTAQIEKDLDNETATKYMNMAVDAVAQAVAYTVQTFTDSLKAEGKFTKEKQLEAFEKSKNKTLEILGDTTVAALREIYGDFDAWLETKIEQEETGDYLAQLCLRDDAGVLMKLELAAPTLSQARTLVRAYEKQADSIYQQLLQRLLDEKERGNAEL